MKLQVENVQDRWAEYLCYKFGCKAVRHRFQSTHSDAHCESIFYLNAKGKLYLPPISPYHYVEFVPTPTGKNYRITRQWLDISTAMITQMIQTGMSADFVFPPEIQDMRPWKWAGFTVGVKYTYYLNFPIQGEYMDGDIQRKISKADRLGYRSIRTDCLVDVQRCLSESTADRVAAREQSISDLETARRLLGTDCFRSYVCYSPNGEPVSASVFLVLNPNRAIGWVLGSKRPHLPNGAGQQMLKCVFDDLISNGLKGIDFGGANMNSIASAKAAWGGEFVPYYTVRERTLKDVLRAGRDWFDFRKSNGGLKNVDHTLA